MVISSLKIKILVKIFLWGMGNKQKSEKECLGFDVHAVLLVKGTPTSIKLILTFAFSIKNQVIPRR